MALAAFIPATTAAQEARYRWDVGASVGMSGYEGDANDGFMFRRPGVALSALGRYNIDSRWAVRAQFGMMTLHGDTDDLDTALPGDLSYSFSSTLYDLSARCEFNFFPYGIGETYKKLRRWTPFVSAGLGLTMSSVDSHRYTAMSVPLGVGVKFKPRERLNLAVELTMAKTTSDHLDGPDLSDIYGIKSSFLKNTDWTSTLTVSVSFEFGERCTVCNRID